MLISHRWKSGDWAGKGIVEKVCDMLKALGFKLGRNPFGTMKRTKMSFLSRVSVIMCGGLEEMLCLSFLASRGSHVPLFSMIDLLAEVCHRVISRLRRILIPSFLTEGFTADEPDGGMENNV
jgi:hypothetical protein